MVAGLVLVTAGSLTACGQKGPLYFPEEPQKKEKKKKKKEPQDQSFIGMPRRSA